MAKIEIKNKETFDDGSGWQFLVGIGKLDFLVDVEKDYWQWLTDGDTEPDELVKKSFEFLLSKEPKESILKQFNLRIIKNYFPEYENEIRVSV